MDARDEPAHHGKGRFAAERGRRSFDDRLERRMIDPVELTRELIRRPSVTPRDEGAIEVLQRALEGLGFACHRLVFSEPGTDDVVNLYARLGAAAPNFCFAGHTDVVPVGDTGAWTVDPFAAELREETLWGRGAADMKGAIGAFAAAVERFLAERGREFGGSISLLVTGDEEGVNINGTKKVLAWLEERGERLDFCVVGEPTNARELGDMAKIGRRGSLTGYLTVKGTQGHTAYPHLADNAAHRLVEMLHALIATPLDEGTAHFQPSTLQVASIDIGNPVSNVIPAEARAVFNARFNDRWSSAALERHIRARLDGAGGRYELRVHVSGESFLTAPGRVSEIVVGAAEQVTGRRPELSTTGGTSDARFIVKHCPVVEFGLVGQTMHQVDERVPVADLERLSAIYRRILDNYFAADPVA